MFRFLKKQQTFTNEKSSNELNVLLELVHQKNFEAIENTSRSHLHPNENPFDALILMVHLAASLKLKNTPVSIEIFRMFAHDNILSLFVKPEQDYLKFYAHNLMKSSFGEDLTGMPSDIVSFVSNLPKLKNVSKNITQIFIFVPNK